MTPELEDPIEVRAGLQLRRRLPRETQDAAVDQIVIDNLT